MEKSENRINLAKLIVAITAGGMLIAGVEFHSMTLVFLGCASLLAACHGMTNGSVPSGGGFALTLVTSVWVTLTFRCYTRIETKMDTMVFVTMAVIALLLAVFCILVIATPEADTKQTEGS